MELLVPPVVLTHVPPSQSGPRTWLNLGRSHGDTGRLPGPLGASDLLLPAGSPATLRSPPGAPPAAQRCLCMAPTRDASPAGGRPVQSHACFTIEFDDCSRQAEDQGPRHQVPAPARPPGKEATACGGGLRRDQGGRLAWFWNDKSAARAGPAMTGTAPRVTCPGAHAHPEGDAGHSPGPRGPRPQGVCLSWELPARAGLSRVFLLPLWTVCTGLPGSR